MSVFDEFRNADGAYNGVKMLAALSGFDEREVAWTAARLKQLIAIERKTKDEAKKIVTEEGRGKPWLES